ncbi:MAG TPA: ribose 5-phosphate isomerase B [archaeon]|nr:ribose 5-phosphate isomerase B [archaeon]HLD80609.1 ribose 5-phosphate isomerase B [archaeon]
MKIVIGSDHAGFELKEKVRKALEAKKIKVDDKGCNSTESCDFPDYAFAVARDVASGKAERGILVCGSGIGMCMAANKVKGVRAALVHNTEAARLSRQHNDANILCLAGRTTTEVDALSIVSEFLSADGPKEERYHRRNRKLELI